MSRSTKKRENPFARKRLETFTGLDTEPKEWGHAKVINYEPYFHTSKSGKLYERWIPEYRIPTGYKNPYDTDMIMSNHKKCQLCDTDIIDFGIILHPERNEFLIVGMDCYEIYEDDDSKRMKIELLLKEKKEFFTALMETEKGKIKSLMEAFNNKHKEVEYHSRPNVNYRAYSVAVRNRWETWTKVKFNNFIVKYSNDLKKIGYQEPEKRLSMKTYIRFYKEIAKSKVQELMMELLKNRLVELGEDVTSTHWRYRSNLYNSNEESFSYETTKQLQAVNDMDLDSINNVLSDDYKITGYNMSDWNKDGDK